MSEKEHLLKRIMDKIFAGYLLLIFSPLLMLIAAAIKLEGLFSLESKGPILVSEPRISKGRVFRLYKFRKVKKKVLDAAKSKKPGTYSNTDFQHDPRNLTFVGKILKKFYLDEFPQIFNVLKGDMSFVGPRPHIPKLYYEELKQGTIYEKIMYCGLTGLVAINKDLNKSKTNLDNEYFEKYSSYHPLKLLFYDMSIMLKTTELVFRARGY